ncbi:MAG TPA: hypothetical protein VK163_01245 [Opitutaceae bacterium]|nr:hypothetical protein [Opitutaceae bacterium]
MNPTFSHVFEVEIPPAGIRPVVGSGDFFLIVEANTTLQIRRTGAAWQPYEQGDSEELPDGEIFERLELKNTSAVTASVKIFVGFGRRSQNRQQVMEPRTRVAGWSGDLAATTGRTFAPTLIPGDLRRKAVIVSNGDATSLRLQLRDPAGVAFNIILPGESAIVPVSETVEVYNPNAIPVTVYVGEIYWRA